MPRSPLAGLWVEPAVMLFCENCEHFRAHREGHRVVTFCDISRDEVVEVHVCSDWHEKGSRRRRAKPQQPPARPTPKPVQLALGHHFDPNLRCHNYLRASPDERCGRTWAQHQRTPVECVYWRYFVGAPEMRRPQEFVEGVESVA